MIGGVTPPETFVTEPTSPTIEPTITITFIPTGIGGGKGWIDTYCNVDGATVYFDGVPQGTIAGGILSVGVAPSGTPVRTVTVSKAGYVSWSGPLSHMPADGEHVAEYATINPVPTQTTVPPIQSGSIYALSSPGGAAIYLNGNYYGYSPITIPNLAPGTYSIKATLSGYSPDITSITVYAGQTSPYYPVLQQSPYPPRDTGTVYVTSSPGSAFVYIDSSYAGKTPLTLTLYPGTHNVRISLQGYNDYTNTVTVYGGQSQSLNAVLSTTSTGSVSISSLPGASVYIDSAPQGTVPGSGVLTIANVKWGNHLFKVSAPGYFDWINTVYVVPNSVTPITASLTSSGGTPTPVLQTGGFNIVSTPAGAEVLIDNIFRGYTPSVLNGIPSGQHTVTLRYTGYVDYTTTAVVNPGQVIPLAISLEPAPTPTPESAASPVTVLVAVGFIMLAVATLRRS